jgi:hypothetical protein
MRVGVELHVFVYMLCVYVGVCGVHACLDYVCVLVVCVCMCGRWVGKELYVCMSVCRCAPMYVCMCACLCVCVYLSVFVCAFVCVCTYTTADTYPERRLLSSAQTSH